MKTFKEYAIMTRGYAIGGIDSVHPIASLGDVPPRGKGSRDTRSVGLTANYTSQAPGTIKPMVTADTKRIPKKPGQKDKSDKHSDLYTDENPKGTIHGLGFTDGEKARQSVNKIKNSGKTHAHKIQAAIAMSQRAKVASERAKDPQKKKDLGQAHKVYQRYIDTNKKSKD
jgi:hypothetical protein|tara:strand:+ start:1212 stop:1721 length:510 start_codon:yes stop_codon:yes gene_type:complete